MSGNSEICDICKKKIKRSDNMKAHLSTVHKNEKNFPCKICNKKFATKFNQERHELLHSSQRPYNCDVCAKKFTQLQHLKTHQVRVHHVNISKKPKSQKSLMTCDLCGYGFWSMKTLERHMHMHVEEDAYSCHSCDIKLPSRFEFSMHQVNIHNRAQHSCGKCQKIYVDLQQFKKHVAKCE